MYRLLHGNSNPVTGLVDGSLNGYVTFPDGKVFAAGVVGETSAVGWCAEDRRGATCGDF
jgi:hypothetical protein